MTNTYCDKTYIRLNHFITTNFDKRAIAHKLITYFFAKTMLPHKISQYYFIQQKSQKYQKHVATNRA